VADLETTSVSATPSILEARLATSVALFEDQTELLVKSLLRRRVSPYVYASEKG